MVAFMVNSSFIVKFLITYFIGQNANYIGDFNQRMHNIKQIEIINFPH